MFNRQKTEIKEGCLELLQLHTASFFRFMAFKPDPSGNSFQASVMCITHGVFSFASANARSMVSFRIAQIILPRSVFLSCSTISRYSCQTCVVSSFCPFSFTPQNFLQGQSPAVFRSTSVESISISVSRCVSQDFALWTNKFVIMLIGLTLQPLISCKSPKYWTVYMR